MIELRPEQQEQRDIAAHIAQEVLAANAEAIDREGRFPRENIDALGRAGLLGLAIDESHGGPGCDIVTTTMVSAELARGCPSTALCYHMHIAASLLISEVAEGDQIARWVEPILRGEHLCTYAISEPGSGSRWWHMDSIATATKDGYVIDAFKSFATSAGQADSYVVPVRKDAQSDPDDLSLFIIERDDPNVETVGCWDSMGMRGNSSLPVKFDGCVIPEVNRLGEPGLGFPLLMGYGLPVFQIGLAGVYTGLAQSALDHAISHVSKRVHADTGESLAKVESIQRHIAEIRLATDQAWVFVWHAASHFEALRKNADDLLDEIAKDEFLVLIGEVKLVACRAARKACDLAVQVCGGMGYKRGMPVERLYRDARAGSIMGPNDDSILVMMGQRTLGLDLPWE